MEWLAQILWSMLTALFEAVVHALLDYIKKSLLSLFTGFGRSLKGISEGQLSVSERTLQEQIDKAKDRFPPEVRSVRVEIRQGDLLLQVELSKYTLRMLVTIRIEVESVSLTKRERRTVLRISDKPAVELQSLTARLAGSHIIRKVEEELDLEKLAATINAKYPDMMTVELPLITANLDALPPLQRLNGMQFRQKSVWDLVELDSLTLLLGEVVLHPRLVPQVKTDRLS